MMEGENKVGSIRDIRQRLRTEAGITKGAWKTQAPFS